MPKQTASQTIEKIIGAAVLASGANLDQPQLWGTNTVELPEINFANLPAFGVENAKLADAAKAFYAAYEGYIANPWPHPFPWEKPAPSDKKRMDDASAAADQFINLVFAR